MDYGFVLTGTMPIIFHADNLVAADELTAWIANPKNKSVSKAGDDRTPPWTWQNYLYHDGKNLTLPQECVMAALRKAGAQIKLSGKVTLKQLSQSGILMHSDHCQFLCDGETIPLSSITRLRELSFSEQANAVRDLGFELFAKRAKNPGTSKKVVRVRPRFQNWSVSGSLSVSDPILTLDVLAQLFEIAGEKCGLGDWRPSSPQSPGPYGMFKAEVKPLKSSKRAG